MFAIRQVGTDVWAGAKNITYFVTSDSSASSEHWRRTFGAPEEGMKEALANAAHFGVPSSRRRVFETVRQVKRALATITGTARWPGILEEDGNFRLVKPTFSAYELVNLVTGDVCGLDEILSCESEKK